MMENREIAELRRDYRQSELLEQDIDPDPVRQFHKWFKQAVHAKVNEPNAMCLSTVNGNKPDSRIVLLKGIEHHGFVFYSNYESSKGKQMDMNPNVHLNFNWLELERQVRIGGKVVKLSAEENDAYFHTRPFESRIGAIISAQSETLDHRETLEASMKEAMAHYQQTEPQRPLHWGGYVVLPEEIEFWQGRPGRLHDRLVYSKTEQGWTVRRLFP